MKFLIIGIGVIFVLLILNIIMLEMLREIRMNTEVSVTFIEKLLKELTHYEDNPS